MFARERQNTLFKGCARPVEGIACKGDQIMNAELNISQDRLGRNIALRLLDSADDLPNDISERLKAARMQALSKRKVVKLQMASATSVQGRAGTLQLGGTGHSIWNFIASLLPLLALIAGLLAIGVLQDQDRAREIADVDAELLSDVLPPAAYTDPGFIHFLAVHRRN